MLMFRAWVTCGFIEIRKAVSNVIIILPVNSLLFGERVKKSQGEGMERVRACRQTFEAAIPPSCLVIADHVSARSLSVTWIHWNVITLACNKGVSR